MWAYPLEYKDQSVAGQVRNSPYQFKNVSYWGPLPFLANGFAVFDDPKMPIVGEKSQQPNDTFRLQLVMSAEAAIKVLVDKGVADPKRIAIGGHSYGAFMVANLLAHSDLFAAGIARSGAYNRSLTPFGFQGEERTFWQAQHIYANMSPFFHAEKINEPILMIHGEEDNNSGTYPMQSKRMFNALKGLGKEARLVMLPKESHGYRHRESLLHMLWEQEQWLNTKVKNK
ncbi:MAG: prolyl oligopeptidase family serine peptidase [Pseudomonadota bacterium]